MNNSEERFFKYLHNELSYVEKIKFEKELHDDESLHKEFQDYKKIANIISDAKSIKLNDGYLNSVIPQFREKLNKRNVFIIRPVIGFALGSVIMILGFLIMLQLNSNNSKDLNFAELISEDGEIESYLDYFEIPGKSDLSNYQIPEIDSVYNKSLEENIRSSLSENQNKENEIFADLSYTEIEEILSDQQLEEIYSQLMETNFTRGSK